MPTVTVKYMLLAEYESCSHINLTLKVEFKGTIKRYNDAKGKNSNSNSNNLKKILQAIRLC